jgi:hypothetical protein
MERQKSAGFDIDIDVIHMQASIMNYEAFVFLCGNYSQN